MALRRILLAVAGAAAFACVAHAQTVPQTAETYRSITGQSQDGMVPTPVKSTSTTIAGTIATGGTYQSALAANPMRKGCLIVNRSLEALQVYLGSPANASPALSIPVPANGSFSCASPALIITDQISVTAATTGDVFVVIAQ